MLACFVRDGLCDVAWCVVVLCLCVLRLMRLCVVSVYSCVMLFGLPVSCDCCVFVRGIFHVFVGVACDLLCGVVWFVVCVCCVCVSVPCLKKFVLFWCL